MNGGGAAPPVYSERSRFSAVLVAVYAAILVCELLLWVWMVVLLFTEGQWAPVVILSLADVLVFTLLTGLLPVRIQVDSTHLTVRLALGLLPWRIPLEDIEGSEILAYRDLLCNGRALGALHFAPSITDIVLVSRRNGMSVTLTPVDTQRFVRALRGDAAAHDEWY